MEWYTLIHLNPIYFEYNMSCPRLKYPQVRDSPEQNIYHPRLHFRKNSRPARFWNTGIVSDHQVAVIMAFREVTKFSVINGAFSRQFSPFFFLCFYFLLLTTRLKFRMERTKRYIKKKSFIQVAVKTSRCRLWDSKYILSKLSGERIY